MANLNSLKWGRVLFKGGFLSVGDVLNITVNQVLFRLTAGYFYCLGWLRGRPGLIVFPAKNKKSGPEKKVLISFVLHPLYKILFVGRIRYYFSINGLTLYIIRAFRELGYTCHVIHAIDQNFKVRDEYQAALFHVGNFEEILPQLPKTCKTIAFETGAYWRVANQKEKERLDELKARRGESLNRDRFNVYGEKTDYMLRNVTGIIALGDDFTKETYSQFKNLHTINSAFLPDARYTVKNLEQKDFSRAKKNFIYFGGGGIIHKGLDLLIEAFAQLPNLNLYLCNNLSPEFIKIYQRDLAQSPNIHVLGYIPQRSKGFYDLINLCAFNLHLSCSEGSPGGVVELLQYGIIPMVTPESNINVQDFGFKLKSHDTKEIISTIERLSQISDLEVKRLALTTRREGFEKFSAPVFLKNLKHLLKDEIKVP